MKIKKIAMVILAIALALYILIPGLSWAEDGTAPQAARCKYVSSAACGTQLSTAQSICSASATSRSPSSFHGKHVSNAKLRLMTPS